MQFALFVVLLTTMNLQARVDKYTERDFQRSDAEILVLIEESAVALFTSFPDRFNLIGGTTLVLFYGSPRLSRDLDLLASAGPLPKKEDVQAAVRSRIQPLAEIFGLGQLEFRQDITTPDFIKHWVLANQKPLFSIDLTRIGGNVLETQIVKKTITDTPEITVSTPNANYLLFQKCETFLGRRKVKARDAFDIHLLLSRGAQLDKSLRPHLEDFITMNEFDEESIRVRIEAVSAKLCTVELRPVLPLPLFEQLEQEGFEPIRQSLRTVFSDWLAGGRR
jgi:Nucleotidyl transferase AbiEii toxin, Type IV TA system